MISAVWLLIAATPVAVPQTLPVDSGLIEFDTIYRLDGYDEVLERISFVLPGPDGTIVVPQRHSGTLRRFTLGGQELGSLGGDGSGPGEFQNPLKAGLKGDSLWVYDGLNQRYTVYGARGEGGLETYRFPGVKSPPGSSLPSSARLTPELLREDGSVLGSPLSPSWPREPPAGGRHILLVDPQGVAVRLVTSLPDIDGVRDEHASGYHLFRDPFASNPLTAASPNGHWFATVVSDTRKKEDAFDVQIQLFQIEGMAAFSTVLDLDGVRIADEVRTEALQQRSQAYPPGVRPKYLRVMKEEGASFYPPVLSLAVESTGVIWLQVRVSAEATRLLRIRGDSRSPTSIVPVGFRLMAAESGRVWMVENDPFGVPSVIALNMQR